MKVTTHLQLITILKQHGFYHISSGKHEKWTNGVFTVPISPKHSKFSMYSAKQILKKAGINSENL